MSCSHCAARPADQPRPGVGDHGAIYLLGTPNSGKSTLFNAMTGARQTVRNSPGTTVEVATGRWRIRREQTPTTSRSGRSPSGTTTTATRADSMAQVTDLPGLYSLSPISADEEVTCTAIDAMAHNDVAVLVADAAGLHGSLLLLGQAARRTERLVIALTMTDVAAANGVPVDPVKLASALGLPVVPVDPRTGKGLDELAGCLADLPPHQAKPPGLPEITPSGAAGRADDLDALLADTDAMLEWAGAIAHSAGAAPATSAPTRSDRIDRALLNGWIGIPIFLAVLWGLFELATRIAAPIMSAAESLIAGPVSGGVVGALSAVGLGGGWLEGLLIDGLLAGVGVVAAFAPLMAMMFLAIGLLEDSGYVARVAVLADRLMRAVGLDGRVVMPLVVGFGCNLPALAATKTLPNARQRLLTSLVIPYTSCPARLTVYILIAGIFFPRHAGLVLLAMYLLSVALVVGGAWIARRTLFRDLATEPLALVLPAYQLPRLKPLLVTMGVRVLAFLKGAGTIIVAVLAVVWLLLAVPVTSGHDFGDVPVHDSAYGRVADGLAPAFAPAGYGDWKVASSLMTGFVAKEVAVGALAQAYAVDEPDDPAHAGSLGDQVRATLERTSDGHANAAALAFLVFVLAYTPCLATVAEQWRMWGPRWTLGAVGVQLAVAWTLSVATFWLLRLVW